MAIQRKRQLIPDIITGVLGSSGNNGGNNAGNQPVRDGSNPVIQKPKDVPTSTDSTLTAPTTPATSFSMAPTTSELSVSSVRKW
jgi:hypothetical protein